MLRISERARRAVLGGVIAFCATLSLNAQSATFVVNNTNDAATGSLREALTFAQTCAGGPHVVTFAIPGPGPHTIQPLSPLPAMICNDNVIDGYSQPGASPNSDAGPTNNANIQIILNGSSCPATCNGLIMSAPGTIVKGLSIHSFPDYGIYVDSGAANSYVDGNYIGTDPGGMISFPNGVSGVHANGFLMFVGGSSADKRNLITGNNSNGVEVYATGVTVQGNQIGGNRSGASAIGNNNAGVTVNAGSVLVRDNHIKGNNIGVVVNSGTVDVDSNQIALHFGACVLLPAGTSYSTIQNNSMVTCQTGISVLGDDHKLIGNTLTGHSTHGIHIISGNNNEMQQNLAYGNGARGISLGAGGVLNDEAAPPYDTDSGPNGLQNHPVITSASVSGLTTNVMGTIKSAPGGADVRIDFFANSAMPPHPEGQMCIGSTTVTLDANGFATFNAALGGVHNYITSTASIDVCSDNCVNTSEYSPAVATGPAPASSAMLSPTSLSFGPTQVGTVSAPQQATLTNTGANPLSITNISLTGPFQFTAGNTCMIGSPIAGGGNCVVELFHAPPVAGGASGQLVISVDAGMTYTVMLNGAATAVPTALLKAEPGSMDFGSVAPGVASAGKTLTITNIGGVPATISSIQVSGAFDITLAPSMPSLASMSLAKAAKAIGSVCPTGSFTLFPNSSCTASVRFLPPVAGIYSGEITIDSNAPFVSVPLSGTSGALKTVAIAPQTILFGDLIVGRTSAERSFTITNTGTAKVTFSSIQLAPSANAANQVSDFILTHNCTSLEPVGAAANASSPSSCLGTVKFKPTALGARSAAVAIAGDFEGGTALVALSGSGAASPNPLLSFSATNFGFGQTLLGVAQRQSFTITNGGQLPVILSQIYVKGDFVVRHNCPEALAAGASCEITTNFVPMIPGLREGLLFIVSNAEGSPHSFPLEGRACRGFSPRTARLGLVTCAQ
jgi:hypothetical protein